jgi:hypothetical protein
MFYGIVRNVMRASADVKSWSFIPSNEVLSLRWKPSLSDISPSLMRGFGVRVMVVEHGVGVGKALLVK